MIEAAVTVVAVHDVLWLSDCDAAQWLVSPRLLCHAAAAGASVPFFPAAPEGQLAAAVGQTR